MSYRMSSHTLNILNDTAPPQNAVSLKTTSGTRGVTSWSSTEIRRIPTWRCEGGELVEELGVFLLAAHATHRANFERKVPDQLARGQLVNLQNTLDVVEIVDQQVALVHAGGKTWR